jgi:hypothetical protein
MHEALSSNSVLLKEKKKSNYSLATFFELQIKLSAKVFFRNGS